MNGGIVAAIVSNEAGIAIDMITTTIFKGRPHIVNVLLKTFSYSHLLMVFGVDKCVGGPNVAAVKVSSDTGCSRFRQRSDKDWKRYSNFIDRRGTAHGFLGHDFVVVLR